MPFPDALPPDFLAKAAALNILPQDITEQFIRGSGAGGQKINKTASCVYLKHGPTEIDVRCQKHREQSKNRISAYKLLILKIEEKVKGKQSDLSQKIFKLRKQKNRRSAKAKRKMLEAKAHRAEIKENRRIVQ
ncbi:MAG: peptide chain release factor-like protein [Candidatus Peribacteraceae bacterium]|nr:peptide chain release factor-like protein [Candidatus Peribacteraceae bacterium]